MIIIKSTRSVANPTPSSKEQSVLLLTTIVSNIHLSSIVSLVATNAARFRLAAGWDKSLIEFGLRRAQGPDGGLSASKYCYIGGRCYE